MKLYRFFSFFLFITILIFFCGSASAQSGAFLIMDGRDGTVLEAENEQIRLPMASTTKVMTALTVIELVQLDESVEIPSVAVGIEGTSLYMKQGEIYTVEELLYGLLLQSANDCAEALAYYAGKGSREAFITEMNVLAKDLGLRNSQFKNPSGLPQEGHYTTAYDLALLMREGMKNEQFSKIVGAKSYSIHGKTVTNHNKLLLICDGCIGGKTGYTIQAGRCLVSVTKRKEIPLICVTLGRRNDWDIHCNAYDRWFEKAEETILMEPGAFSVQLKSADGLEVESINSSQISLSVFPKKTNLIKRIDAPFFMYGNKKKGAVAGTVSYFSNGVKMAESPLVLKEEIRAEIKKDLFISRIFRFFRRLFLKNN